MNFAEIVMIGDFNLPDINWNTDSANSTFSRTLLECLQDNAYEQMMHHLFKKNVQKIPSCGRGGLVGKGVGLGQYSCCHGFESRT